MKNAITNTILTTPRTDLWISATEDAPSEASSGESDLHRPPGRSRISGELLGRSALFFAVIGLIALGALMLRTYRLADIPNGFHLDEASIGYNARCVLETGRDEHGVFLPLYFEAFGEYKNPIFIYLCVSTMAVLGTDVFSVRFTSALLGALTVFATGLLGAALLGRWGGVIAAALLAVSPWHFQFSRIAFEAISLPLFITLAVWLLILADRHPKLMIAASVPLAIATYSYGVAKLFVPLLLVGFVVIRRRWLWRNRRPAAMAISLLVVLVLPNIYANFEDRVQARFRGLYIGTNPLSQELGRAAWRQTPMGRHGPSWLRESSTCATATAFAINYKKHLSIDFLLLHGDSNPRHNSGGGMLSPTEFLAAAIGVLGLGIGGRRWSSALLLWWLFMAPVPASLTALGIPHAIRTIPLLPLPQILAAFGICTVASLELRWWAWVRNRSNPDKDPGPPNSAKLARLPVATLLLIICIWPADIGHHLTRYFEVYPVEVWRPFFWEENAVAQAIRDRPNVERFFIGQESQRIKNVILLFEIGVPPRQWLDEHRVPRVYRSTPDPAELRSGDVVVCRPGDPRFSDLPLLERIVDPLGHPSIDLRRSANKIGSTERHHHEKGQDRKSSR